MRTEVHIGPKSDLHTGAHYCLIENPPADIKFVEVSPDHWFLHKQGLTGKRFSPYSDFHVAEVVDGMNDNRLFHSSRWPVLNRNSWVADTDDFGYPVLLGRAAANPLVRDAYVARTPNSVRNQAMLRAQVMLRLYLHPSCGGILFRTEHTLAAAREQVRCLGVGVAGESFLKKCHVVYPAQAAIDEQTFESKWRQDIPLKVVFCGRDFWSKGGEAALLVFSRLRQKRDVHLTYIGDIPEPAINRFRDTLSCIEHVPKCQRVEVLGHLRSGHILFHPSQFESVGIVLLEACAMGMAVICAKGSRMPDLEELLASGGAMTTDRDVIPPHAEVEIFDQHLAGLISDRDRAKNMASSNWKKCIAGRLSLEVRNQKITEIYDCALRSGNKIPLKMDDVMGDFDGELTRITDRDLSLSLSELQLQDARFEF